MTVSVGDLRIGFVSGRTCWEGDGGLWTDAGLGRLVDGLGQRAKSLTVALGQSISRRAIDDHRLRIDRAKFHGLPEMSTFARGVLRGGVSRQAIAEVERSSDVLVVQLPFQALSALPGASRPRVYHLCCDVGEIVASSKFYRGPRRIPALAVARTVDEVQRWLVHADDARVVANGRDLLRRYRNPRGSAAVSATILDREIGSVQRTRPADAPFRILFVGLLRHEKGIDTLLDALDLFRGEHPHAELHVVGAPPHAERGLEDVKRRMELLETRGNLRFLGHRPFGPHLFTEYANADVLVLASRSEGTPRVLVEARAFGCPVVATRVGGIPTSVSDGHDGLLVPPDDPPAIAAALRRIAEDPSLRQRLIANGYTRARECTVEAFVDVFEREIRALFMQPHLVKRFADA